MGGILERNIAIGLTGVAEYTVHWLVMSGTKPGLTLMLLWLKQPILKTQRIIIFLLVLSLIDLIDRLKHIKNLNIIHLHIIQSNALGLLKPNPTTIIMFLTFVKVYEFYRWALGFVGVVEYHIHYIFYHLVLLLRRVGRIVVFVCEVFGLVLGVVGV